MTNGIQTTSYRVRLVLERRTDVPQLPSAGDPVGLWHEDRTSRAYELHDPHNPVQVFELLAKSINGEMTLVYALPKLEREA